MKSNSSPAINITGLTKRYDEVVAVNDITFQVSNSELFGFLGPNGAGKTTTINLLTGLARLDGQTNAAGKRMTGTAITSATTNSHCIAYTSSVILSGMEVRAGLWS
ncbi:ATP-binding cassette domain-containing protein [Chloroflexota bacterium]